MLKNTDGSAGSPGASSVLNLPRQRFLTQDASTGSLRAREQGRPALRHTRRHEEEEKAAGAERGGRAGVGGGRSRPAPSCATPAPPPREPRSLQGAQRRPGCPGTDCRTRPSVHTWPVGPQTSDRDPPRRRRGSPRPRTGLADPKLQPRSSTPGVRSSTSDWPRLPQTLVSRSHPHSPPGVAFDLRSRLADPKLHPQGPVPARTQLYGPSPGIPPP
jgi:hypothetical protein